MRGSGSDGFSQEQLTVIIRAVLAGADGRAVSENEIAQIADMLWVNYVAGHLVEMVLAGELLVSLADGELAFAAKEDGGA